MGGSIFTQRYEYANPLTRIPGLTLPSGTTYAYNNLHLTDITFGNNLSYQLYQPPVNALSAIPLAAWVDSSLNAPVAVSPGVYHRTSTGGWLFSIVQMIVCKMLQYHNGLKLGWVGYCYAVACSLFANKIFV